MNRSNLLILFLLPALCVFLSCGGSKDSSENLLTKKTSFDDLEALVHEGNEGVSEYLLARGWTLDNINDSDWKDYLTWRKGGATVDEATEWFSVQTHGDGEEDSWVFYQIWDFEKYSEIKEEALAKGMRKIKSQTLENGLRAAYEDDDYVAVFESVTAQIPYLASTRSGLEMKNRSNGRTTYKIRVYLKKSFYRIKPYNTHLFDEDWHMWTNDNNRSIMY